MSVVSHSLFLIFALEIKPDPLCLSFCRSFPLVCFLALFLFLSRFLHFLSVFFYLINPGILYNNSDQTSILSLTLLFISFSLFLGAKNLYDCNCPSLTYIHNITKNYFYVILQTFLSVYMSVCLFGMSIFSYVHLFLYLSIPSLLLKVCL